MLKRRKSKVEPPSPECPLMACMHFLGGAWTPNILWYLKAGPRRFSELKDDVSGISAKVLTQRLKRLEDDGLILRTVMPTSPPTVEYSLTELGEELKPAIESIASVGEKLRRKKALKNVINL
jgi:DNA-binding HxlR family transcriptional regulator